MSQDFTDAEFREIGIAIAGLEVATWAAMRSLFDANPEAGMELEKAFPALLAGLSGTDAQAVKDKAAAHIRRWLGEQL